MIAEPRILQFPRRTGGGTDVEVDAGDHSASSSRMLRRALCAVTPIITGSVDVEFLTPLVHELVSLFGASRGSVMLLDVPGDPDSTLRMRAHSGLPDFVVRREAHKDGVAARVVKEAQPTLIFDRADRDARFKGVTMRDEIGAAMCAPIATPTGVVFGVINISRERGAICAGFSRGDLEICDAIAMLVGDALERHASKRSEAALRERMRAVERLTMMGEVAAGIAHEIATPMSCVRTNITTLLRYFDELKPHWQPPSDPHAAAVAADVPLVIDDIRVGVERAELVMKRMKALVRLERGQPVVYNVATVLNDALRLVKPRLRAGIVIECDNDLKSVGSDVDLIQVIVNLLVNADDAIALRQARQLSEGAVVVAAGEIQIRAFAHDDHVVVEVEDNGAGIAAADLDRVFQPLFTTKHAGTGLGLSISRRLVAEHGGRMHVAKTSDAGTTFRVALPQQL